MPRPKSFLYAVRMLIPNHDPQPIKVGFSTVPDKRRLFYNCGPYPCEWLGVWPGTVKHELEFHVRFYELNHIAGMAGEWFLPNEEFLRVITTKITAYKKVLDRQAKYLKEREERRAMEAVEREATDRESRIRAARIMEEWVGNGGSVFSN